jgi:hypothetical protein
LVGHRCSSGGSARAGDVLTYEGAGSRGASDGAGRG